MFGGNFNSALFEIKTKIAKKKEYFCLVLFDLIL